MFLAMPGRQQDSSSIPGSDCIASGCGDFSTEVACALSANRATATMTVLGGLAEFERELIRARTGEGRERAKVNGVRFGRPLKLSHHQRREALERLDAGESVVDIARTFGVDRATLYRLKAAHCN
jgi:DNA invertase Pin-like site-specific DNA recombinase